MKMQLFNALVLSLHTAVAVRSSSVRKKKIRILQKVPKDPNANVDPVYWTNPPTIAPTPIRVVAPAPTQAPIFVRPPTIATTQAPIFVPPTTLPPTHAPIFVPANAFAPTQAPISVSPPTVVPTVVSIATTPASFVTLAPTVGPSANLTACEALAQGQLLQSNLSFDVNFQYELVVAADKSASKVIEAIEQFLQIKLVDELIRPYCMENPNRQLTQQQSGVLGVNVSSTKSTGESCSVISSESCVVIDTTVTLFLDENGEISDFKPETLSVAEKSIHSIPQNDDNTGIVKILYLKDDQNEGSVSKGSAPVVGANTASQQENHSISGFGVAFVVIALLASIVVGSMYALKKYSIRNRFIPLSPGRQKSQKPIKLRDYDEDFEQVTMEVLEPNDTLESSSGSSAGMAVEAILADLQSFDERGLQLDFSDYQREVVPSVEFRTPQAYTDDSCRETVDRKYSSPDTVEL